MEEIDIIELLQRVKKGNAPKKIEIDGEKFLLKDLENPSIECLYYKESAGGFVNWIENVDVSCNTKIKILDKPIIEELSKDDMLYGYIMGNKINEIIKWINKENK